MTTNKTNQQEQITTQQTTSAQSQKTQNQQSTLQTLAKKFSSRKFILSLIGVIIGIAGMIGCNDDTVAVIAFIALEILSIVAYLITEGKVDAAAVKTGINIAQEIADAIADLKDDGKATIPETSTGKEIVNGLPEDGINPCTETPTQYSLNQTGDVVYSEKDTSTSDTSATA